jgi:O-acetyl-ADP-ribose deacetylase (regulator of RNase III)
MKKKGNLFSSIKKTDVVAHCIAADAGMGAGIAVDFVKKYPQIKRLRNEVLKVGKTYYVSPVLNIVTKRRSPGKPSYESMCFALQNMAEVMRNNNITEVYMPKIGCGLDRLSWPAVKEQLKYVFGDSEVTFNVYYL